MSGIGLASAFRTLTIIPVSGKDSRKQATMLFWFPVVGLVLGGLSWGLARLVLLSPSSFSYLVSGALVTVLLAWLTRGFHLDGLADMADGFGGGWTKERTLEIMKDSHVGAFGVIALVLLLATKVCAIAAICATARIDSDALLWLLMVPILSRMLLAVQTAVNRYARPVPGTAGILVRESRWYHGVVACLVTVVPMVLSLPENLLIPYLVVLGTGVLTTLYVGIKSRRRLGGVTGDILGATCELSETSMLVVAALLL